jgi:hypothetical protein
MKTYLPTGKSFTEASQIIQWTLGEAVWWVKEVKEKWFIRVWYSLLDCT